MASGSLNRAPSKPWTVRSSLDATARPGGFAPVGAQPLRGGLAPQRSSGPGSTVAGWLLRQSPGGMLSNSPTANWGAGSLGDGPGELCGLGQPLALSEPLQS